MFRVFIYLQIEDRNLFNRLDPDGTYKAEAEESKKKANAATRHLDGILAHKEAQEGDDYDDDYDSYDEAQRRSARLKDLALTPYEQTIALQVVAPNDIPVTFEGTSSSHWRANVKSEASLAQILI